MRERCRVKRRGAAPANVNKRAEKKGVEKSGKFEK